MFTGDSKLLTLLKLPEDAFRDPRATRSVSSQEDTIGPTTERHILPSKAAASIPRSLHSLPRFILRWGWLVQTCWRIPEVRRVAVAWVRCILVFLSYRYNRHTTVRSRVYVAAALERADTFISMTATGKTQVWGFVLSTPRTNGFSRGENTIELRCRCDTSLSVVLSFSPCISLSFLPLNSLSFSSSLPSSLHPDTTLIITNGWLSYTT